MHKLALVAAVVTIFSFSDFASAQSHTSIQNSRSSYGRNIFFKQSILGFSGRLSKKGDASVFGTKSQTWTGYGIRDGIGMELYKFIHISITHTHVDQEAKSGSLEHFDGSELQADFALSFDSPIGNLNFGVGGHAGHLNMQNVDKSSRFAGTGRNHHVTWNYFVSPAISLSVAAEQAVSSYRQNSGDTGIDSFTLNRDALGLGFKLWF